MYVECRQDHFLYLHKCTHHFSGMSTFWDRLEIQDHWQVCEIQLFSCIIYLCIDPKPPKCCLWDGLGHFLCPDGPSDMSLVTLGTVCWGMLWGFGSDVIKPSCSVCFCKVKTNTSMSIWTQLWYFYLPHQLQAAIIISNLMKLVQHLASSCLFDSEQMEGHLVWVEQTGSSWGGVCIPTFIQRFKAAFLHLTSSAPVMILDQTKGTSVNITVITCSSLRYPDSYTTTLWTLSAIPDIWFYNFVISDPQKRTGLSSL